MQQRSDASEPAYLTLAEAAAVLRVSRTTIWRWIADGRLPAYRAGRRAIRIRREDVQNALRPARAVDEAAPSDGRAVEGDMWAGYDPERARAALCEGAGALVGVDRDRLLSDVRQGRRQRSRGRPE
jgi:excisionase family DNA binding protein